jgi:hypothetical protein
MSSHSNTLDKFRPLRKIEKCRCPARRIFPRAVQAIFPHGASRIRPRSRDGPREPKSSVAKASSMVSFSHLCAPRDRTLSDSIVTDVGYKIMWGFSGPTPRGFTGFGPGTAHNVKATAIIDWPLTTAKIRGAEMGRLVAEPLAFRNFGQATALTTMSTHDSPHGVSLPRQILGGIDEPA